MALKTRPPTGRVPWPLILIEGAEKAGKSWACAELSASPRVGQTYWIDLGEGSADEYGAIPGARYLVVEHNGTFAAILAAVEEVKALAVKAADAGEPPVVLVLDSMTAEWDLLKGVADQRARARLAKKGRRVADDEEPQISMDLWNDVNGRHRKLMTALMTFPGIACITARGKDVAALDGAGRPIENSKEYKVDGQKNLAYDASVWIRVSRDHPPMVVGARSVHAGVKPGVDKPRSMPDLSLERVVFDILQCQPVGAQVRDLVQPQVTPADLVSADATPNIAPETAAEVAADQAGPAAEPSDAAAALNADIATAADKATLGVVWKAIGSALDGGQITQAEADRLAAQWQARKPKALPATQKNHAHMHVLWAQAGYSDDRDGRLAFTAEIVGRDISTSKDLTGADYDLIVARLTKVIEADTPPAEQVAA